jgi:prepilin-type N-terminal cleavage/methylation domain-containing protein
VSVVEPSRDRGFTLIELLIVVAIIGIIAAIAIPSLLRARASANEAATVGDIRTVISAEAAYHAATGGYYGTLPCLADPRAVGCIPSYPANGPTFIDSQLGMVNAVKSGYNRSFVGAVVPRGLSCYVYAGVPANPGQTGVRAFGGDCSGRVCATPNGAPVTVLPPPTAALDPSCLSLQ